MSDSETPSNLALEALGLALFLRGEDGALREAGESPAWLRALWPVLDGSGAHLPVADASPFFENFLIDAEECWRAGGEARAHSGPWIEEGPNSEQVELEATALNAGGHAMLLINRLGAEFVAKKEVLQKARETVIAHQRLNSEIQKKEILLHCVADDMTATLANIVTSLRLIETEDNPPRTKMLLGLSMRGAEEQQRLISRVLEVFSDEIGSIYGREGDNGASAEWESVLARAFDSVAPAFAEKNVQLVRPPTALGAISISAEAAHLERVLTGLLENALERTPARGAVTVEVEAETDAIVCRVIDSAERMSTEAYDDLFSKFGLPAAGSHESALRLHFCRIVIESCGGEIGCEPGEASGNSFWFRLPKSAAS